MKLFVSYSRDDKNFVYELVERFKHRGKHDVWIDRDLGSGQLWWETVLDEIESCECFIVFLTPRYLGSNTCLAELQYALEFNKEMLPLMLKACEPPASLHKIQRRDISSLSLDDAYIHSAQDLLDIRERLLKRGYAGGYAAQIRPPRPSLPKSKDETDVWGIFEAAELAAAEHDLAKAEALFQKVIEAEPQGLGIQAVERLAQVREQHGRAKAYIHIAALVEKGLIDGAKVMWRNYVQQYGTDHDPNNYIAMLSNRTPVSPPVTPLAPTAASPHKGQMSLEQGGTQVQVRRNEPSSDRSGDPLSDLRREPPTTPDRNQHVLEQAAARQDTQDKQDKQDKPVTFIARDRKEMRLIPASKFIFGDGEVQELPDFYIDTWEVTNEEYRRFIVERNITPPAAWRRGKFPEKKANHPVTGVSWYEATAYAAWAGKRLPTAAEWEKAARGTGGRHYPWGERFDVQYCNTSESGQKGTTSVTQYQSGASLYGVLDMAGNVWEWTLDEMEVRGLGRQNQETKRVLKGGSWNTFQGSADCAASSSARPQEQLDTIGFRCVLSLNA